MAYLRRLDEPCDASGCARRATVELVNRMNAPLGRYCREHGRTRLREQERSERELSRTSVGRGQAVAGATVRIS